MSHRVARMHLVLDAVEAGHQHRGKAEIRIGERIGEADFDALGLRVGRVGNAARGRTVARRVGEQHRRFEARHQTLVGVGGRVGEGVDRLGVLDDAGDVGEAGLRQIGVFVAGEHRLAGFPDRLMAVHARAVVAVDRLRHERRGLAVDLRDLLDAVFVDLHHGRPSASSARTSGRVRAGPTPLRGDAFRPWRPCGPWRRAFPSACPAPSLAAERGSSPS